MTWDSDKALYTAGAAGFAVAAGLVGFVVWVLWLPRKWRAR